ncbi:hypothetical protein TEA_008675 [Camellia sinensis var. sinensis]|uniref:Disease resistance R13L4/SHOC-2-like LRR domain-containing protein n=1 Tax=Camellia sinensis var. sinensis TaxID=542762 RepID=A0A4S4E3P8_CAMSN|nr:hypothetical protein TEA_008675 [Camellia sinensis var. sinensis]
MLTPRKSPTSIGFSLASLSRSLVSLSLEDCNLSDDAIPKDLGGLSLLQHLDLNKNPICNLPDSIRDLTALQKLELAHCTKLHSLPELPMSLNNLNIHKCSSLEMVTNLPNLLRSLVLAITSCDSLVEIQGLFKLVPIKNINAEMFNNMGWFNLEAMGKVEVTLFNVMTIRTVKVPLQQTYAKSDDRRNEYWDNIFIRTSNKTKGFKWIYSPTFVGLPKDNEHMIWLSHWKIGNQLEGGDEVDVTVFLWAYMKLKEFGIQVVYEQEENNTQQGDLYPSFHNVVNEDLSAYQVSTGMYFLCHHDFDIYQDCSKSGGWTSKGCHWKIGNQLEGGDEVAITVFLWAYVMLKEFSIQVVYEQEENNTQQGDLYPSFHNVVNEDLSAYQVGTSMYFLCHHYFDIYQDCSKSGGWTSKGCINAIGDDQMVQNQNERPEQGLNDLANLEKDLAGFEEDLEDLYFFEEEETSCTRETRREEEVAIKGKAEVVPLTEKELALEQFRKEMIEEIQAKIALEQGKGKGKEEPEAIVSDVQITRKVEWDPNDRKRMLRKIIKYRDVETRAVVEEECPLYKNSEHIEGFVLTGGDRIPVKLIFGHFFSSLLSRRTCFDILLETRLINAVSNRNSLRVSERVAILVDLIRLCV